MRLRLMFCSLLLRRGNDRQSVNKLITIRVPSILFLSRIIEGTRILDVINFHSINLQSERTDFCKNHREEFIFNDYINWSDCTLYRQP